MSSFPSLTARQVVGALKRAGFVEDRQRGSHFCGFLAFMHFKKHLGFRFQPTMLIKSKSRTADEIVMNGGSRIARRRIRSGPWRQSNAPGVRFRYSKDR